MKTVDVNELYNLWLVKFHNITIEEVIEKYPEEIKTIEWYKLFPCTREQHDWWVDECKKLLNKKYKYPKYYIEKAWWSVYLNVSPYVSDENYE